jgi:hypothetical protein
LAAAIDDDGHGAEKKAEKKPEPAPLAPKPVAPPHDPETGEVGPHEIDVPKDKEQGEDNWIAFGQLMIAAVKTATNKAEIDKWLDLNKGALEGMKTVAPKVYKRFMGAIDRPVVEEGAK